MLRVTLDALVERFDDGIPFGLDRLSRLVVVEALLLQPRRCDGLVLRDLELELLVGALQPCQVVLVLLLDADEPLLALVLYLPYLVVGVGGELGFVVALALGETVCDEPGGLLLQPGGGVDATDGDA